MSLIKINDTRDKKVKFDNANAGDLVIDNDGDMFFIVESTEGFALLGLNDFAVGAVSDTIFELLSEFNEDWGIDEIVPTAKLSITIK